MQSEGTYTLNAITERKRLSLQIFLSLGAAIYMSFYAFESPIRYILYLANISELIFIRDVIIAGLISAVFIKQFMQRKLQPSFWIFIFVVCFHGLVMIANFGSFLTVVAGAKMLLSMLFGALTAQILLQPSKRMLGFYFFLWFATVIGIVINKYWVEFPWAGIKIFLGGIEVEINRDWTLRGVDKRSGGFARSSIQAAMLTPFIALILLFNTRNMLLRIAIVLLSLFALYCTTQKGSILSFAAVAGLMALSFGYLVYTMRIWFIAVLILVIALPLALPGYNLPQASGQFSAESFNARVEIMWPEAFSWINNNELFPFGVGLGGLGSPQRIFAPGFENAADNLYVFMYGNYGVLTFVYLGWFVYGFCRLKRGSSNPAILSMAILTFVMGYGVFLSMIEDQMASLFTGAAAAYLAIELKKQKQLAGNNISSLNDDEGQKYAI